ncbi:MAG TPA: class I SAM-dependent methyltransferase [Polyangiaceae bacterium]|nr:class I SAM-dependent methyltransferase [Polyangiaceae bacterium]
MTTPHDPEAIPGKTVALTRHARDCECRGGDRPRAAGASHCAYERLAPYLDLPSRLARDGCISDLEFDEVYPLAVRAVSSWFWTPVRVALRAAQLLAFGARSRVLDVGSGAGKFCILAAASTGATFVGVEQRERFVRAAREAARRFGVTSAQFVHGTMDAVNVLDFDAVYLFNPFEENLWQHELRLDDEVELSAKRFAADVAQARRLLSHARLGTRVVTYHGFGGRMPVGYSPVLQERTRLGDLDLWIKTQTHSEAGQSVRLCVDLPDPTEVERTHPPAFCRTRV